MQENQKPMAEISCKIMDYGVETKIEGNSKYVISAIAWLICSLSKEGKVPESIILKNIASIIPEIRETINKNVLVDLSQLLK